MEKKKIGKKVLKIVLLIIIVLIVIFFIYTIRNYLIITNLQEKILQYSNNTNYYTKLVSNQGAGCIITMKYYTKDNKQAVFLERNLNGEITKVSMYNNGERTDTFTESANSKIAHLNSGTIIAIDIYNHLQTDNNWQTFLESMHITIKSTNYNGKECYIIKGFVSPTYLTFEKAETYIDKETGLSVKTIEEGFITEKEYEFNNVDDSIFIEPDISQYTLKENK